MNFRIKLGVAAAVASLLVLVIPAPPALAANWAARNSTWTADNAHPLPVPETSTGRLEVNTQPNNTKLAPNATVIASTTPMDLPLVPSNYRHAVLVSRPENHSLRIRAVGIQTNDPNQYYFVFVEATCSTSGNTGGTIASTAGISASRPFVGLFFQADGNTVLYAYAKDSAGNPVISTLQFLWASNAGSAASGLTFAHGKLMSGSWTSGNIGCDPRTGPIGYANPNANNLCIDIRDGSAADNTIIQIFTCNGTASQIWTYNPIDQTIRAPGKLNKCLQVQNASTSNGTPITLFPCNPSAQNYQWLYNPSNKTLITALNSSKCLDVPNGSTSPGTGLQLFDCNGTDAQKWNVPL